MFKPKKTTSTIIIHHKTKIDDLDVDAEIKATGRLIPEIYATREQPGELAYFDEIEFEAVNFHPDHLNAVLDEITEDKGIPVDYYASDLLLDQGEVVD
jgi:hypothetical protein